MDVNIYLSKPEDRKTAWVRMRPIIFETSRGQQLAYDIGSARRLKTDLERAIKELEDELEKGRLD